ncbi:MAG: glycoside hydrolase family 9 protein [Solirubrobacteraceae bacterium]|nr:glycoside hydrolase family 9 protein [Solirubrobacteraceae bacterium]
MRWRLLSLSALVCLFAAAPAIAAPPDTIRVGGPSSPDDAKVAVVGTSSSAVGRTFRVVTRTGRTVLTGRLTAARGTAAPWRHTARADLSAVRTAGSYTVRVGRLRSRTWLVRPEAQRTPVRTILRYFSTNADGREPSPAHGPSHLHDAVVATGPYAGQHFDLTGGWMDAGDTLKFTQTTAYAAAALQAAARLDPADAAELRATADVGVRWLVKAHPRDDLFIAQVGDERDHQLGFRDPASDDASPEPGIGTRQAYPNMGGDLGGKAALALALAADRATGAARDALLDQARTWYAAGVASGRPAPDLPKPAGGFYVGDTADDALAAGAAALYRSTGEQAYLESALRFLGRTHADGSLSWNRLAGFAAADLCGRLGAPAVSDAAAREIACRALTAQGAAAIGQARSTAFSTPGPFGWGQTGQNASGALATAAGTPEGASVGTAARDWLLGLNPWGASFVAGFGPRSPQRLHHWASLRGRGRPAGGVVGGPAPRADILAQHFGAPKASPFNTPQATYEDNGDDYVTSEPAIDYAAGSILLLAIS